MRPLRLLLAAAVVVATLTVTATAAHALLSRSWVSGVGDDDNPCSRTAPCKTFAGAISKTAENGEIDALDPGGFGAVTITKGITLDGNGFGSILAIGTTGIVVNAGATDAVVIRNMTINGGAPGDVAPATGCPYGGIRGVNIVGGGDVHLQGVSLQNTQQALVSVAPTATATKVSLDHVTAANGCGAGVDVAPTGTGSASVLLRDSSITGTSVGLRVGAGGSAWLTGSTIFGNGTGLLAEGGGTIEAVDANQVVGNGTDGAPTKATSTAPPQVVTTPGPTQVVTTPAQVVTVQTPAPARCIVPTLTGLTAAKAKAKLEKAGCTAGTVKTKATTSRKRVGKVLSQTAEAGLVKSAGTKVGLTVGKKATQKRSAQR